MMQNVLQDMINSALAGTVSVPTVERDTFGIKGTIMRADCSSSAAGIKLPSEGFFQLAFAFRIKQ